MSPKLLVPAAVMGVGALSAGAEIVASEVFLVGTHMQDSYSSPLTAWWDYLGYDGPGAALVQQWRDYGAVAAGVVVTAIFALCLIAVTRRRSRLAKPLFGGTRPIERGVTDNHGHAEYVAIDELRRRFPGPSLAHGGIAVGEAYSKVPDCQFDPRNPKTWGQGGKAPLLIDPCTSDAGHSISFAGTGGYKTVCLATTQITWTGSAVVLDPSREIGPMAEAARRAMGHKVYQLNPDVPGSGFDALAWIDPDRPGASMDVLSLTAWICGEEKQRGNEVIFDDAGRNLVACLLAHIAWSDGAVPRTLATFVEHVSLPDARLRDHLRSIAATSDSSLARRLAPGLMDLPDQTFGGVLFNATTFCSWLYHDQNIAFLAGGSFDPRAIITGKATVYIQPSLESLIRTPGLARVIIGILGSLTMNNERPDAPRTLFDIDEAARLGNMMIFEVIRDVGRKYGPVLRLWYQSEGQLKDTWGQFSTAKWYESLSYRSYAAVQSDATAKAISAVGGTFAVMAYSEGTNDGRSGRGMASNSRSVGRNENRHEISRQLVRPEEVITARTDEQFLIVRGLGLARCGRCIYFRRPEIAAKLTASRFHREVANA